MPDYIPSTDPSSSMGHTSYAYDAYGTLMLPDATISDAIRIFSIDVEVDSSSSGGLTSVRIDSSTTYAWIADGSVFAIVQWQRTVSYSRLYLNGEIVLDDVEGPDTTFSINPDYGLVSSVSTVDALPALDIFPTAASDEVNVRMDSQSLFDYSIYSMNGRPMDSGLLTGDVTKIDISEFDPGYYIIKVEGFAPHVFLKMD